MALQPIRCMYACGKSLENTYQEFLKVIAEYGYNEEFALEHVGLWRNKEFCCRSSILNFLASIAPFQKVIQEQHTYGRNETLPHLSFGSRNFRLFKQNPQLQNESLVEPYIHQYTEESLEEEYSKRLELLKPVAKHKTEESMEDEIQ